MSRLQAFKTGSVVATGVIAALGVEGFPPSYGAVVGGTFVGTAVVEVSNDPEASVPVWVAFGSALTAPGSVKVDVPVKAVRVRCSAYTSGTISASIGATE